MSNIFRFQCIRCGHEWASQQDSPRVCPKCKTPYWDTPKQPKRVKPVDWQSSKWERLRDKKILANKWGRWKYNPTTHCLEITKYVGSRTFSYEVDLERCNTGAKLLDWIYQVKNKNAISLDDIADLIYAVEDIFKNVQSKLCSCGENLEFDVDKYLVENVDPLFEKAKKSKTID